MAELQTPAQPDFISRLETAVSRCQNPTVLGLDPKLEYLPASLLQKTKADCASPEEAVETALFEFNRCLIDAVKDIIPCVKPQLAYYELYGLPGLKALERTIRYARQQGLLVIADGKRNDIGSTSAAYAEAWLNQWDADALTVNAYLGQDGIKPFIETAAANGKGLFMLVRTSNPSAADLQDLQLADGRRLYEAVADLLNLWSGDLPVAPSGYSLLGAVVGATWPQQAQQLRLRLPRAYILVPGYGAQGATAEDCMASFDRQGRGALVNASRSLMLAYRRDPAFAGRDEAVAEACRAEALRMRASLQAALARHCG
ncbi:MAG: orotidine-5'-phosphate decarboxylase [Oscillospiraceae bacterium]|nr:orotidine-5'-phosphate decarboxylase [Oscillospiraceae bacterium]MDD4368571.1 orotidine-5'-phosphate decarboxylase [Oscillospiraceae bacterium]